MPKYTSEGIVHRLLLHKSAAADLDEIDIRDLHVGYDLRILLQRLGKNQRLLESLTIRGFGALGDEPLSADPWIAQQARGRNLWRLKFWELEDKGQRFRAIYTLDPRVHHYYVLAILNRDFNYESNHPRVLQVLEVHDNLGIPGFPGSPT